MITEKQAFMINVSTNVVTEIQNKPDKLVPPVCTDGHFFYSIRVLVRKGKLSIFSFINGQFTQENKVVLRGSIADSYSELRIPFVTDGIRMTFATPRGRSTHFIEFSLETGNMINDLTLNCSQIINSWCIRPYGLEHVALTSSDISFYRGSLQIPRWIVGIPFPQAQGTLNPFFVLMNVLFHGACIFPDPGSKNIREMLESFIETRNANGIFVAGMMFLENNNEKNIDDCVNLFVQVYQMFNDFPIRRFCLFLFLVSFQQVERKEIYRKKNILNDFLEDFNDFSLIWMFPNLIDFKVLKLSQKAIDKLIPYVCQNVRSFPHETVSIMLNCCAHYIDHKVNKGEIDDILVPFKAIFQTVVQKVQYYLPSFSDPSDFVQSNHFMIWKFVLKTLYKIKKEWSRYAETFYPILSAFIFPIPEGNPNNLEVLNMLNRTLYVFLGMLLSSPYQRDRHLFESLQEYYQIYPDPFNALSKSLDRQIYQLLSVAYDVRDRDEFHKYFVLIRKKVLFDPQLSKHDFEPIINSKSLSVTGLVLYLSTKNTKDLCSFSQVSLLSDFIKNLADKVKTLTIPQQTVFSLYSSRYAEREAEFLAIEEETMQRFMKSFTFPFFFPPAVLSHCQFDINSEAIENVNEDFLLQFFDALCVILPQVKDINSFVNNFLERAKNPVIFASPVKEPQNFKASLLCYLAVKNGATINMETDYQFLIEYITSGSTRVISVIMNIIAKLDENETDNMDCIYDFLLCTISNYIVSQNNYFVMQADLREPMQSLFIIISFLKKLFNQPNRRFHHFLDHAAQLNSLEYVPAIFAILQNSLEVVRKDVVIHFHDHYDTEVKGKVTNTSENRIKVVLENGEQKDYRMTQVSYLWCEPETRVDLEQISDFSFYFTLFATQYDFPECVDVFRYASLLEFIKLPTFYSFCSNEFLAMNRIHEWNRRVKIEEHMLDFFYSLATNSETTSPISFVSIGDDIVEMPVSPIAQNCLLRDFNNNQSFNGMLMTMNEEKIFVSSPFHPRSKFTFNLQIYPSVSNGFMEYSLVWTVFAYSTTLDVQLESKPIKIIGDDKENVPCKLEYDPETRIYRLYVRGSLQQEVSLPVSVALFYFEFEMKPSTIIDYHFDTEYRIYRATTNPDPSLYKMCVSKNNTIIPVTDSSVYNFIELSRTSEYLIDCFKQLIEIQTSSSKHVNLPPNAILQVLSTLNSAPFDMPINIDRMQLESIFNDSQRDLFDVVREMPVDYMELIGYFRNYIKDFSKFGYKCSDNCGALIVPKDTNLQVKNCTLITETKMSEFGCSQQNVTTTEQTCIIPNTCFENSFLQCFSMLHYIITLMIRDQNYDFAPLLSALDEFEKRVPALIEKISEYKELMSLLSPNIPKDPNARIDFDPHSLLIPESIVHKYPRRFLTPAYAFRMCKPLISKEKHIVLTQPPQIAQIVHQKMVQRAKEHALRVQLQRQIAHQHENKRSRTPPSDTKGPFSTPRRVNTIVVTKRSESSNNTPAQPQQQSQSPQKRTPKHARKNSSDNSSSQSSKQRPHLSPIPIPPRQQISTVVYNAQLQNSPLVSQTPTGEALKPFMKTPLPMKTFNPPEAHHFETSPQTQTAPQKPVVALVHPRGGKITVSEPQKAISSTASARPQMAKPVTSSFNSPIELNENQFVLIQSPFDVEYENSETECVIYILPPDVAKLSQEIQQWCPHNTHQLLCAFPLSSTGKIRVSDYLRHPLSSKFSYETAEFVRSIVSDITSKNIFSLRRHVLQTSPFTERESGQSAESVSTPEQSDVSETTSQLVQATGSANQHSTFRGDHQLMDIKFCKLISDAAHNTIERIAFVRAVGLPEKAAVDADSARITYELPFYAERHQQLHDQLFDTCIGNKRKSFSKHWLKTYLRKAPTQVILHFIEFVNGKYGLHSLKESPIYMWLTAKENVIESVPNEGVVILGKFETEEQFVEALKVKLQQFIDSRFAY